MNVFAKYSAGVPAPTERAAAAATSVSMIITPSDPCVQDAADAS